ncbi:endosome-associated-trafficking regulator 1 [Onthophagus taurus]|uniref:endosome-associated-trafficking regulator 1 n=1 Tax=Onthophagus taurus TaxID=166361 RepID=UPI0039BDB2A5
MAEGDDGSPDGKPTVSRGPDEDCDDNPVRLDAGATNEPARNIESRTHSTIFNDIGSQSPTTDPPKKEDNPFSFKHFLRSGNSAYHNQGARPKVYCDGRPVTSMPDLEIHNSPVDNNKTRVPPEFSSALPDFVQDHLVVEQCYLNKNGPTRSYTDMGLPDFAPSRPLNLDSSRKERRNHPVPLDLPVRPPTEFPLDLPVNDNQNQSRSCAPAGEVAVSKSLPDFLADGAVRTQNDDTISVQSPEREVDRCRQELEIARRQLADERRRTEHLQRQLDIARNKEKDYTQSLGKALEQVEQNLDMNTKRMVSSENMVVQLRKEMKELYAEITRLKRENSLLRCDEGAAGTSSSSTHQSRPQVNVARDLRVAANSAEQNLRQLLSGVDNLRMIASTLENMCRIEETSDPLQDYDRDSDSAGPAL